MEEALYDMASMRGFAGLTLSSGSIPDETTILNFRHLLERNGLATGILQAVNQLLQDQKLLVRQGTIVDATLIDAPSSTKNRAGARDPEMHQTKKGNQWHFGMKAHIGVDLHSGLVHTVVGTAAFVETDTRGAPMKGKTAPEWVCWFNHHRLLAPIGYVPPAEAEASYYQHHTEQAMVA